MAFVRMLLEHQPLLVLFLTMAIGYLVGEITIKGFSLGVGAVLFVALAMGWLAPKAAPAALVGTLGLALFLYTVGVQYGKQFVLGLTSASGRRANMLALLGALQLPLLGSGKLALGVSGVLIVALLLGNLRRTGGMNWTIPLSANLVLRNLGLTLFLAQVGMSSGPTFAATVTATGVLMLGLGAAVLVALVLPILVGGLLVFRMPYDEVAGIVVGACGNPAILAYANRLAPTDRPDIGYAMIFPGMTIITILFVDIVPVFFSG